ncbi:MAG: winged helix-turn-helix transcriptional regulator [Leptospirales bacterium]|nr:winged helix-turn-helix transcriptional regulator [Leptospirales bacterium]
MTTNLSTGRQRSGHSFGLHLEVSAQVVTVCHRLRELAMTIHGEQFSAGLRGVLRSIKEKSRTVPELARMRPVSRQHMQQVVDILIERKLARSVTNPAHARSNLIEITSKGRKEFDRMMQIEKSIVEESFTQAGLARLAELSKGLQWYLSELETMKHKLEEKQ